MQDKYVNMQAIYVNMQLIYMATCKVKIRESS